ncbi:MAG: hypothetical protein ACE5G1_17860, partial [bacterium]
MAKIIGQASPTSSRLAPVILAIASWAFSGLFTGPVLVTAANIIQGAAKIAKAKPELTPRITRELLKVEKATMT